MTKNERIRIASIKVFVIFILLAGFIYAQTERWVYRYNGSQSQTDWVHSLVYGTDNNIYAAGESFGNSTGVDFTVISTTESGAERWIYIYEPATGTDNAHSLVYGEDNNIYIGGFTKNLSSTTDYFTVISLTPSGNERWVYQRDSGLVYSITYGSDGNVYAGGVGSHISGSGVSIISLTNAGTERWVYSGPGPMGQTNAVIHGADGNVYAIGYSYNTSIDLVVVSLTSTGNERWVYTYNGPGEFWDHGYSIVYGSDGNIYIAGATYNTVTYQQDFTVISLTATGSERWIYTYDGAPNFVDEAYSIICGPEGNIYAGGYTVEGSSEGYFTVISLTTSGTERWIYRGNWGYGGCLCRSIVYGADGYIYAAGEGTCDGYDADLVVVSLTNSGIERWHYYYDGPATNSQDHAYSVVYGNDGNIYAAGRSEGIGTYYDIVILSIDPTTGIKEHSSSDNAPNNLHIGPNPFNDELLIEYCLLARRAVSVEIYNILGLKMKTLINEIKNTGPHKIIWDGYDYTGIKVPSGVYILKFDAGDYVETRKLILLRP